MSFYEALIHSLHSHVWGAASLLSNKSKHHQFILHILKVKWLIKVLSNKTKANMQLEVKMRASVVLHQQRKSQ